MATLEARRKGAILGTFVADAAAQPTTWIDDKTELDDLLGDKEEVEFHIPPGNPFYRIANGCNTCYGDQAFLLLESLVACKGFNKEDFARRMFQHFGPGTEYDNPVLELAEVEASLPIQGPWKNECIKHFLKNYSEGKQTTGSDADDIDCVARLAPLVALYAGRPDLLVVVEAATRVTQQPQLAATCALAAARLLERYILHGSDPECLIKVVASLRASDRAHPQELDARMAALLQHVSDKADIPHQEAAPLYSKD